jgi:hypothetical protein
MFTFQKFIDHVSRFTDLAGRFIVSSRFEPEQKSDKRTWKTMLVFFGNNKMLRLVSDVLISRACGRTPEARNTPVTERCSIRCKGACGGI